MAISAMQADQVEMNLIALHIYNLVDNYLVTAIAEGNVAATQDAYMQPLKDASLDRYMEIVQKS